MRKKRVVIAGMGFGGFRAARTLAGQGFELVLVDRQNYHLFQPLLYQVATAGLEEESIAFPVRAVARNWPEATFRMAEITGLDADGKRLLVAGGDIGYDYLILAAGSVTNFFGNESIREHASDLKRLDHAVALRNRILSSFEQAAAESDPERRRALLTFVIVGGGPTGVEFAGSLAELIRFVLARDYPEIALSETRIVLLEAAGRLFLSLPEKLSRYAAQRLGEMGVEVVCGARVSGAEPDRVLLADGSAIPAHTLFWSAGVKAEPLTERLGLETGNSGRVRVLSDLTVPGRPELFVVGDMALVEQEGGFLPMVAPVAMQQGEYAAAAIMARERGESLPPFRYRDRGAMATIGRSAAVARSFGVDLTGFPAWLVWLGLHLFYLIGFRNRIMVLLNWAWYYFLHERQVRLITRSR